MNIYQDLNFFFVVLSFTMISEINYSKISIKQWCGLVRASLNFVGALLNLTKLLSSLARARCNHIFRYIALGVLSFLGHCSTHSESWLHLSLCGH